MRILAIDSSSLVATAAVVEKEAFAASRTVAEYTINYKKTHSQTLLPMIDEIVKMTELDLSTIDAIAVAGGPGSFTGLRIGSATAKGLGLALNRPLIHVPTVDGMAYNLCYTDQIVCPIMDARRSQVYTGIYEFADCKIKVLEPQMAVGIEELGVMLRRYPMDRGIIFLGDGVPVHRKKLEEELMAGWKISFAPAHMNAQRAAAVGALAAEYCHSALADDSGLANPGRALALNADEEYKGIIIESAADHRPEYLRASQAERERAERIGHAKEQ